MNALSSFIVVLATLAPGTTAAASVCDDASVAAKRTSGVGAAISMLEEVKKQCSSEPKYLNDLAAYYFAGGRLNDASNTVEAGLRLDPNNKHLLFSWGDVQLSKSNPEGAKSTASRLMQLHPDSWGGPYLMQRALLDLRRFEDAIKYGDIAIGLVKDSPVPAIYLNNAVASYHSRQNKLCVDYVEAAIARDPNVLKQAWGIDEAIYALHELGRRHEALALAKRRKEADPDWHKDPMLVRALRVMGVVQ